MKTRSQTSCEATKRTASGSLSREIDEICARATAEAAREEPGNECARPRTRGERRKQTHKESREARFAEQYGMAWDQATIPAKRLWRHGKKGRLGVILNEAARNEMAYWALRIRHSMVMKPCGMIVFTTHTNYTLFRELCSRVSVVRRRSAHKARVTHRRKHLCAIELYSQDAVEHFFEPVLDAVQLEKDVEYDDGVEHANLHVSREYPLVLQMNTNTSTVLIRGSYQVRNVHGVPQHDFPEPRNPSQKK